MQNKSLISRKINYSTRIGKMLITKNNLHKINALKPVQRVVSLVPSLTETIAFFGGVSKLAGVTRFCRYPEGIREKAAVVGGPKDFDVEKILSLGPDVVVAVKEENDKARILQLADKVPVILFDVLTFEDALEIIKTLGSLLGAENQAAQKALEIKSSFEALAGINHPPKSLYLIWKKPWMAAGKATFINEMLQRAGFENVAEGRYPEITEDDFLGADVLLLSSEPYPFNEKHRREIQQRFPGQKVILVDGEMFSWYGIRMLQAAEYFRSLRAGNH